jgi:hypothetical protein
MGKCPFDGQTLLGDEKLFIFNYMRARQAGAAARRQQSLTG